MGSLRRCSIFAVAQLGALLGQMATECVQRSRASFPSQGEAQSLVPWTSIRMHTKVATQDTQVHQWCIIHNVLLTSTYLLSIKSKTGSLAFCEHDSWRGGSVQQSLLAFDDSALDLHIPHLSDRCSFPLHSTSGGFSDTSDKSSKEMIIWCQFIMPT